MDSYEILSNFYDEFLEKEIDYDKYCNFILNELKKGSSDFDSYLDLACGTGNLSLIIGKNFKKTICIDISENMLSIAYNKFLDEKIHATFLQSDICNFKLNEEFSLVTCSLDSFNYILDEDDLLNSFKNTYDCLIPGGLFIFDINSKYKIQNILGDNIFIFDEEDVFCAWENEYEDNMVDMHLTFFVKQGNVYKKFEEDHTERAYEIYEIKMLLKEAGFNDIKCYSDYSYDEITDETNRITFIVRK